MAGSWESGALALEPLASAALCEMLRIFESFKLGNRRKARFRCRYRPPGETGSAVEATGHFQRKNTSAINII